MSHASGSMQPRACGPLAFPRWLKDAMTLSRRVAWEWWAASVVLLLGVPYLIHLNEYLLVPVLFWGLVISQGMQGVGSVVMRHPQSDFSGQWRGFVQEVHPWAFWLALGITLAVMLAPVSVLHQVFGVEEAPPSASPGPKMMLWAIVVWCGWALRPLGPMGFVGRLVFLGCPLLKAMDLQMSAFFKNTLSILCLAWVWIALAFVMVAVPILISLLLILWPLVMRIAFADIFEGGVRIAQPAPAAAKVPARAVAQASL